MSRAIKPQGADMEKIAKATDVALADFEFFCRHCVKIRTKDGTVKPLIFNNAQRIVYGIIRRMEEKGLSVRIIVLKARQMGISTLLDIYILWRGLRKGNTAAMAIAHEKQDAAPHIFGISRFAANNLPEWFLATAGIKLNVDTKMRVTFDQGFEFSVTSADSKSPGRSLTILYAHISEMAFYADAQKIVGPLFAAMPKLREAVVLIESTGNGPSGLFFDTCQAAKAGKNAYAFVFLPWYIHEEYRMAVPPGHRPYCPPELEKLHREGVVDDEQLYWREWVVQNDYQGNEQAFSCEYPATEEQAWMQDAEHVFQAQAVQARLNEALTLAPITGAVITAHMDGMDFTRSRAEFSEFPGGNLTVYHFPEAGHTYVIGADVGSGTAARDPDFSCADVVDVSTGEQAAHIHLVAEPEVFGLHLYALGVWYMLAMQAIETTGGHGQTAVNWLRDHGYQNLFMRRVYDQNNKLWIQRLGWNTSKASKPIVINIFRADFMSGTVKINHPPTLQEMSIYVQIKSRVSGHRKMQALGQGKDDRVVSGSLAAAARRDALGILDAPGEGQEQQPAMPQVEAQTPPTSERMAFRQRYLQQQERNESDYV